MMMMVKVPVHYSNSSSSSSSSSSTTTTTTNYCWLSGNAFADSLKNQRAHDGESPATASAPKNKLESK